MIKRSVLIDGVEVGPMQGDSVEQIHQYLVGVHGCAAVIEISETEWVRLTCPACGHKLIGCGHPYCPSCRDAATAARKAKRKTGPPRCRDCGSFGPVDDRGFGWDCGCAGE